MIVTALWASAAPDALAAQPLVGALTPVAAVRVSEPALASALQRQGPGLRKSDGWKLGGMAMAAALLSTADRRGDAWARRPAIRDDATLRQLSRVGDVTGKYVALGIGPAAWALGRMRGDSGTAVLGLRTTESVALSTAIIAGTKFVAGRTRPYASADNSPRHWDLFGGGRSDSTRSFASGHAALAAAAAVTLAAEWRRQGRSGWKTVGPPMAYALATLTAGSRVRDRQHWLSDVVAGAAVGMASALLVRRWHDAHPRSWLDRTLLAR
jgi:membrane-associated phospholipid phosphatase